MSTTRQDFSKVKRITTHTIQEMKQNGVKISMLTAYDFSMARILDEAGIDVLLVGDSASNVMAGHETTLPITLDQMIYHATSVVRGAAGTGGGGPAFRFLPGQQQDCSGKHHSHHERIRCTCGETGRRTGGERKHRTHIVCRNPGHGAPGADTSVHHKFGTYTVRATEEAEAQRLQEDAILLEQLGCFSIVLEKIPADLGGKVAKSVHIPIIGIGAGPEVDGQVLVMHDMLGLTKEFKPRFLRRYLNLFDDIRNAVHQYTEDVKSGDFPNDQEQY